MPLSRAPVVVTADVGYFDERVVRRLRSHVRLVCRELGLLGERSYLQADDSVCAYVVPWARLSCFPDRDVVLFWGERHGWSPAVETRGGEDLLVLSYLGQSALPPPRVVTAWARSFLHRGYAGDKPNPLDNHRTSRASPTCEDDSPPTRT